jgi:hypothetical protein
MVYAIYAPLLCSLSTNGIHRADSNSPGCRMRVPKRFYSRSQVVLGNTHVFKKLFFYGFNLIAPSRQISEWPF